MKAAGLAVLVLLLAAAAPADEPDVIPHRQDRPPNKPYPPAEAVRRMTVPEGFSVELVAAEPDIVNPIAMAFDDRGRIWVTESVEYPTFWSLLVSSKVSIYQSLLYEPYSYTEEST